MNWWSTSRVFLAEGTGTERMFRSAICKQFQFVSACISTIRKCKEICNGEYSTGNQLKNIVTLVFFNTCMIKFDQSKWPASSKFDRSRWQIDQTLPVDQPLFSALTLDWHSINTHMSRSTLDQLICMDQKLLDFRLTFNWDFDGVAIECLNQGADGVLIVNWLRVSNDTRLQMQMYRTSRCTHNPNNEALVSSQISVFMFSPPQKCVSFKQTVNLTDCNNWMAWCKTVVSDFIG